MGLAHLRLWCCYLYTRRVPRPSRVPTPMPSEASCLSMRDACVAAQPTELVRLTLDGTSEDIVAESKAQQCVRDSTQSEHRM